MTNAEQARRWLKEAETWLGRIERAEEGMEWEMRNVRPNISAEEVQYGIYAAAKDNFGYQRAGRKLAAAQERATMYGIMALLDEVQKDA